MNRAGTHGTRAGVPSGSSGNGTADEHPAVGIRAAARVWARIGMLSFGGPAGQIALMHRILVDEKRWISESRFLHALNFCMLLPGPEAQQLATYIGWVLHRMRGGLIAGTLFILPGFFVILALSYLYVLAGTLPLVQGIFFGLKAAVVVIVLQAVIRISRRALTTPLLIGLAVAAFIAMFVFSVPFPLVILISAFIGLAKSRLEAIAVNERQATEKGDPAAFRAHASAAAARKGGSRRILKLIAVFASLWLTPTIVLWASLGPDNVFAGIGAFFSKMAVVTFGGAYAVLAYVSQEAVQAYGWLLPGEMIDGLAMAETTPGPLIMVVQFVGFIAAYQHPGTLTPGMAGLLGATLAIWVTFVPCFLWIFLGAPYMERLRRNALLSSALAAVTAAVVGVIANLATWFAMHTLFAEVSTRFIYSLAVQFPDLNTVRVPFLMITAVAALLVFRFKASVVLTLAVTSVLGTATVFL